MVWHETGNLEANVVPPCRSESHVGHVTTNFTFTGVIGSCRQPLYGRGGGGKSSQQTFLRGGSSWRSSLLYSRTSTNSHLYTMVTFLVDSPYIYACSNLSKTATFSCPQGGRLWRSSTVHHIWLKKKYPLCIPSIEKCCPLNIAINKNKTESRFRITWNKLQCSIRNRFSRHFIKTFQICKDFATLS